MSENPSRLGEDGMNDERAIARKYGIRELVYPEAEQVKTLVQYLTESLETGRSAPVPKMAVMVMLEFLQATVNRQHITKGPTMDQVEYDMIQAPYYLTTRLVSRVARAKKQEALEKGTLYETTYLTVGQLIELLRSIIDPGCYWLRLKEIPAGVKELMDVLRDVCLAYPEQRRKGRAI